MALDLEIDPDIRRARTLPASFYRDDEVLRRTRERLLPRSWQLIGDSDWMSHPGTAVPVTLLPGCLDEPLLLTCDAEKRLRCLSNVCTHRANILVTETTSASTIRCRYHGRRFGLDGHMVHMPEFEQALDFPSDRDDLPQLSLGQLGKFLFTSMDPRMPFDEWIAPVRTRLHWLPLDDFKADLNRSRQYTVKANWALYCDNYLEGFHIPFVHPGLGQAVEYATYQTELFRWGTLQIAHGPDAFTLPIDSPDSGQSVAAYYFFLFPNTMLNFYPWGLSVNVVVPLSIDQSRVHFFSYVGDPSRLGQGAGANLDGVEAEDEAIVEAVQRGMSSRLYKAGRYSPTRETGVHHFHRLLAEHCASVDG